MDWFEKLIEELESEDCVNNGYTITTPTGVKVWVANLPVLDTSIWHPGGIPLTWRQKWRLWRATKRCGIAKMRRHYGVK